MPDERLTVPLRQLDHDLPVPAYARPGDAGVDLYAREPVRLPAGGGRAQVPTGVAVAIPAGYAGFIQPRSGLIDAGYRGELIVLLVNTDPSSAFLVERGDRIAQLVIQKVEHVAFDVVDFLDETERGVGGWGHTG